MILAQITFEMIIGGVLLAVIPAGIIGVTKHCTNEKKHPPADEIVFKDVCASAHKGLEGTIEAKFEGMDNRFADLKETTQRGLDEIKLILRSK